MPKRSHKKGIATLAILIVSLAVYIAFFRSTDSEDDGRGRDNVAAVAVAPIETRPIELRRAFSGALEAHSKFVVAPKVSGRVVSLPVDISDTVQRGDTVAILDAAEFDQTVKQAEAELAVAEANLSEAKSALEIAIRVNQRTVTLRERGIASASEFDSAQADLLAQEARVKVAEAQVTRAQSMLQAARIRMAYTRITADWPDGDDQRVIADRYIDEGDTVSANDPLLLIVELNPITAVIHVTERDYGLLSPGLEARFTTDAFPEKQFSGKIARVSPVFRESSRQARVELSIENPESDLKPGMFVRTDITLDREEDAVVVPYSAITRRGAEEGVFLVANDGKSVSWRTVRTGIRSGEWIQLLDENISGRVVTLGQHLIDDGSPITIPDDDSQFHAPNDDSPLFTAK